MSREQQWVIPNDKLQLECPFDRQKELLNFSQTYFSRKVSSQRISHQKTFDHVALLHSLSIEWIHPFNLDLLPSDWLAIKLILKHCSLFISDLILSSAWLFPSSDKTKIRPRVTSLRKHVFHPCSPWNLKNRIRPVLITIRASLLSYWKFSKRNHPELWKPQLSDAGWDV